MGAKMVGEWTRAGIMLKSIQASIRPVAHAKLYETGELVVERMIENIESQSISWTPLSEDTVRQKGGNNTIYVDSGTLKDKLSVRRVATKNNRSTIFIGASTWKTHQPSGLRFSDLMIFLEYGTRNIPARPLVRPTWHEVEKEVENSLGSILTDLIKK